ncbi:MAG: hypothetical protein U9R75_09905 [Candidatus Thermoplasmatota archaeon]|nr:hypothetical protein [Candidatus Thermoplasmatota archaeon]
MSFIVTATLVLFVLSILILGYLGMKYPRGRKDWPHDRERTYRYVITGILFVMIFGLIYWVTRYWDYPASGKAIVYIAFIVFPVLVVLGFIFPTGKSGLLS